VLRRFGSNWLRRYSHVLFDFINIKISFKKDERTIKLKGIMEEEKLQMIIATKFHKNMKKSIFGFFV
jgi:hypothetical protein